MKYIFFIFLFLGSFICLNAQQILLDEPVSAGELTLFKSLSNPNHYYYLLDKPRLAIHTNGEPQFSFVRYVKNEEIGDVVDKSIRESQFGGGIVHALVEFAVSDAQKSNAENDLKRINGAGKIVGPIVYKSGTIALITSVAKTDGGMAEQVVGLGNAPVLENQKSAVSIQLNSIGAKLLWEMFQQTTTPDISFSFEMEVEGFLAPKNVLIEADFEKIYKHQAIDAAATGQIFAAEVNATFDELSDEGAIKVTQVGHDEELDRLKETAYAQLVDLMFDKVGGTGVADLMALSPENQTSMLDRASSMLESARKEAKAENEKIAAKQTSGENEDTETEEGGEEQNEANGEIEEGQAEEETPEDEAPEDEEEETQEDEAPEEAKVKVPEFAVGVSYKLKKTKQTGKYRIDLNKYTETSLSMRFDENVFGGIGAACPNCFSEFNLDDPLMKQREILVTLGLTNIEDFKHINYVNIIMKKMHENGQETLDELRIDRSRFAQSANLSKMVYGWKGDNNRDQWLFYDYNVFWSFTGGHEIETGWQNTIRSAIALEPPIIRKLIYIEVDGHFVEEENIRALEIRIYSQLGDKTQTKVVNLNTREEELSKNVEILLPTDIENYEYEVVYSITGSDPVTSPRIPAQSRRIDIYRIVPNF